MSPIKELAQMILKAHEACKSECMNFPWCSGHVRYDLETHDQWCDWQKHEAEIRGLVHEPDQRTQVG